MFTMHEGLHRSRRWESVRPSDAIPEVSFHHFSTHIHITPHITYSLHRCCHCRGTVEEKRGRLAPAEGSFREALAMCRRLAPPQELTAALALDGLAAIARRRGDLAAAEAAYAESCELSRRHLGEDPQGFANALQGRAVVQRDRGNLAAAKSGLRQGIDRLAGIGGTGPQIAQARRLLAKLERMPESSTALRP